MKSRKRRYIQNTSEDESDQENDELRLYLTIAQDEEKEVDYEILDRKYPIKEWKTELMTEKIFSIDDNTNTIFDREDLNAVYQLVMDKYQYEMPEDIDQKEENTMALRVDKICQEIHAEFRIRRVKIDGIEKGIPSAG
ncbi:hypothetical protein Tco_0525732 [Tanacetum coccineum]